MTLSKGKIVKHLVTNNTPSYFGSQTLMIKISCFPWGGLVGFGAEPREKKGTFKGGGGGGGGCRKKLKEKGDGTKF